MKLKEDPKEELEPAAGFEVEEKREVWFEVEAPELPVLPKSPPLLEVFPVFPKRPPLLPKPLLVLLPVLTLLLEVVFPKSPPPENQSLVSPQVESERAYIGRQEECCT